MKLRHVHHLTFDKLICAISIICVAVVLVLKDIFQVLVLVLVLGGQVLVLGGQVQEVLVLVLVLGGQVLVLVLVLGSQVLVNIPAHHPKSGRRQMEQTIMNIRAYTLYKGRPTCRLNSVWRKVFIICRLVVATGLSRPILKNLGFLKNLKSWVFRFFYFQVRIFTFSCQTLYIYLN